MLATMEPKAYGRYLVYPDGRIWTNKYKRFLRQRVSLGYCVVSIGNKEMKVHRLVAMCFIPNPFGKKEVNHKDANKTNNWHENLEWVTKQENISHAKALGLYMSEKQVAARKRNGWAQRVPAGKRELAKSIYASGEYTTREVASILGISGTQVSRISRGVA